MGTGGHRYPHQSGDSSDSFYINLCLDEETTALDHFY